MCQSFHTHCLYTSGHEVIAPVREIAAQVLALVAGGVSTNKSLCQDVLKYLTALCAGYY